MGCVTSGLDYALVTEDPKYSCNSVATRKCVHTWDPLETLCSMSECSGSQVTLLVTR